LQSLISENRWEALWEQLPRGSVAHPEQRLINHTSASIWRDLSKCIECGLCVEACGGSGQPQYVILTTRELARMIKSRGIAFHAPADDGAFDVPLAQSKGAAPDSATLAK